MQRFFRACLDAGEAENAFGAVFSLACVVGRIHVHRTYLLALAAGDALFGIVLDAEQGEVTGRFQEDRHWADVFAEGAVILKGEGQGDARDVIDCVTDEEAVKHDPLQIGYLQKKQGTDEKQGACEHQITDESQIFSRLGRNFIG